MPEAQTVDVEALLSPIEGPDNCGQLSRFDPVFDEIRKARSEENRDALEGGAVQADWRLVIARTSDVLQKRAKDLMMGAYLTEALSEANGFAGLRDGLRVVTGLLERFWEGVHPRVEEGDVERRLAPLIWMTDADRGSRLPNRLRELPIMISEDGQPKLSVAFSKSAYAAPKAESESDSVYEQRRAQAEQRAKTFQDAVAATPVGVFGGLRGDIDSATAEVTRFNQVLNDKFGTDGPSVGALREALEDCGLLVTKIFKDKGGDVQVPVEGGVAQNNGTPGTATAEQAGAIAGPIRSRQDALKRLQEVAAFFRQTEPHSPIPYLIERAIAWGGLSLEQLIPELVKDSSTRDQIKDLLGFKRE
jgi:type VI secretion system protein ImpA